MGDFSRLNMIISEQEKRELRNRGADNDFIDYYFHHKNKEELNKKSPMKLSWDETNLLNDIRKQEDETENTTPESLDDQYSKVMNLLAQCVYFANKNGQNDLSEDFSELRVLFSKLNPISKKCNKKIKKSKSSLILKSGNIVEGYASSEIIDSQNDFIKMDELKKALPDFMEHGTISLNHSNRPVGRLQSYRFEKTKNGNDALYIICKLFNGNEDVIEDINKGKLNGFSIGGTGSRNQECNTETCFNKVSDFRLFEISLCRVPANEESYIIKR